MKKLALLIAIAGLSMVATAALVATAGKTEASFPGQENVWAPATWHGDGDRHFLSSARLIHYLKQTDSASGTTPATVAMSGAGQADLSITKSDMVNTVTVGDTVSYTVSVINNGPDTARWS